MPDQTDQLKGTVSVSPAMHRATLAALFVSNITTLLLAGFLSYSFLGGGLAFFAEIDEAKKIQAVSQQQPNYDVAPRNNTAPTPNPPEPPSWKLDFESSKQNMYDLMSYTTTLSGPPSVQRTYLYAAQGGSFAGDSNIYFCDPTIDADANIGSPPPPPGPQLPLEPAQASNRCDRGEPADWVLSFHSGANRVNALVHNFSQNIIYAGQGGAVGDGDIYYCAPGDVLWVCSDDRHIRCVPGSSNSLQDCFIDTSDVTNLDIGPCVQEEKCMNHCSHIKTVPCATDSDCKADGNMINTCVIEWLPSYNGTAADIKTLAIDNGRGVIYAGQQGGGGAAVLLGCKIPAAGPCLQGDWLESFNSPGNSIDSIFVDEVSQIIYATVGEVSGGSMIYACDPASGQTSSDVCEPGDWIQVFESSAERISSLGYDSTNGIIYAGQSDPQGSDRIYRCLPGADGVCLGSEWAVAFIGSGGQGVSSIVHDSSNNLMYAGLEYGDDNGSIFRCSPGGDGVCSAGEWAATFDVDQLGITSMLYEPTTHVLYATQWGEEDDDILVCDPGLSFNNAGQHIKFQADGDGACECTLQGTACVDSSTSLQPHEWLDSMEVGAKRVWALGVDTSNHVIYGLLGGAGDEGTGDVVSCRPKSDGNDDGKCDPNEWQLAYDSVEKKMLAFQFIPDMATPENNIIYIGQGGDDVDRSHYSAAYVFYCMPNTSGNANGRCEPGEWTKSFFDGTKTIIKSFAYDHVHDVLYMGSGGARGELVDADIYRCSPHSTTIPAGNDGDGICECDRNSNGVCESYEASTNPFTGVTMYSGNPADSEWVKANDGIGHDTLSLVYDYEHGVLYSGNGGSSGVADIFRCQPGADNVCSTGEWTKAFNDGNLGSNKNDVFALLYDNQNDMIYAAFGGNDLGEDEVWVCNPAGTAPAAKCDNSSLDWKLSLEGFVSDLDGTCSLSRQFCDESTPCGPQDGTCNEDDREFLSLTRDSVTGTIYAGHGDGKLKDDIYACNPTVSGDGDGKCEYGEWLQVYQFSGDWHDSRKKIESLLYDPEGMRLYSGHGGDQGDADIISYP